MRLGDLDALKRKLQTYECAPTYNNPDYRLGINDAICCVVPMIIAHQPTIDAVPVVRCKDCKHWISVDERIEHMECSIFCGCYGRGYPTNADDFCSYGERKGGEGNGRT